MSDRKEYKARYREALDELTEEGVLTDADLLLICDGDESAAERIRQKLILKDLAREHNSGIGIIYSGEDKISTIEAEDTTDNEVESDEIIPRKIFLSYGRADAINVAQNFIISWNKMGIFFFKKNLINTNL